MRKWVKAIHEILSRKQQLVMTLILSQEGSTPSAPERGCRSVPMALW
jgi:hypothetical protein